MLKYKCNWNFSLNIYNVHFPWKRDTNIYSVGYIQCNPTGWCGNYFTWIIIHICSVLDVIIVFNKLYFILYLQYKCDGGSWTSVDPTVTSSEMCDYKPYTQVTCRLKATNDAGDSSEQVRTVVTACDGEYVNINLCIHVKKGYNY